MKIGRVLRDARKRAGLSQEALAAEAKLHRTYVSMLERDIKSPTLDVFFRICHVLKVAPSTLMARIENTE